MSGFRDDDQIRQRALELALRYYSNQSGTYPSADRIIEVAETFYRFMNNSE